MPAYQNILIAIDFSSAAEQVMQKGLEIAGQNGANIHVLHVVEHLLPLDFAYEPVSTPDWYVQSEENIHQLAEDRMNKLRQQYQLSPEQGVVSSGTPKQEIVQYAQDNQVDLIVIGSHGRHGFQRLLGSTAYPVLHNAHCDVLSVRIHDEQD